MVSANPFAKVRVTCETMLKDAFGRLFPETSFSARLELPPTPEFGMLASSVCFEIAKQTKMKPLVAARKIAEALDVSRYPLVQAVEAAGGGYINFYADFAEFSRLTIESIRALGKEYGYIKVDRPTNIIVEHTAPTQFIPSTLGKQGTPCLAML